MGEEAWGICEASAVDKWSDMGRPGGGSEKR